MTPVTHIGDLGNAYPGEKLFRTHGSASCLGLELWNRGARDQLSDGMGAELMAPRAEA
jgi:hypothetical protein